MGGIKERRISETPEGTCLLCDGEASMMVRCGLVMASARPLLFRLHLRGPGGPALLGRGWWSAQNDEIVTTTVHLWGFLGDSWWENLTRV